MDKRINLLNSIKNKLTHLVTLYNINENEGPQTIEASRLKTAMINENILSGFAINDNLFKDNEVYAESNKGKLNYHIYPNLDHLKPYLGLAQNEQEEHIDREKTIKVQMRAQPG